MSDSTLPKGPIPLELRRAWAPHGVERFYHQRGREKAFIGYDGRGKELSGTTRVSRSDASVEAYLRFGLAFGQ